MARKEIDTATKERGESFARRLKQERERLEFTQNELSMKSRVPLDTVRSIENGRILTPNIFIAADLVHALEGDLDEWITNRKRKAP